GHATHDLRDGAVAAGHEHCLHAAQRHVAEGLSAHEFRLHRDRAEPFDNHVVTHAFPGLLVAHHDGSLHATELCTFHARAPFSRERVAGTTNGDRRASDHRCSVARSSHPSTLLRASGRLPRWRSCSRAAKIYGPILAKTCCARTSTRADSTARSPT